MKYFLRFDKLRARTHQKARVVKISPGLQRESTVAMAPRRLPSVPDAWPSASAPRTRHTKNSWEHKPTSRVRKEIRKKPTESKKTPAESTKNPAESNKKPACPKGNPQSPNRNPRVQKKTVRIRIQKNLLEPKEKKTRVQRQRLLRAHTRTCTQSVIAT